MKTYSRLIDDYILGNLSPKERKEFEDVLAKDPKLQAKLKFCNELKESLVETDVHLLREKLVKSHNHFLKKNPFQPYKLLALSVAASILVFLVVRILMPDTKTNYEEIFQEFFQPYQMVGEARDNVHEGIDFIFGNITKLYLNKQYKELIPLLDSIFVTNPRDFQTLLMLTSALLETGNTQRAEELLSGSQSFDNELIYSEYLQWYLALTLVKQGKTEEAKRILKQIVDGEGFYANDAQKIQRVL